MSLAKATLRTPPYLGCCAQPVEVPRHISMRRETQMIARPRLLNVMVSPPLPSNGDLSYLTTLPAPHSLLAAGPCCHHSVTSPTRPFPGSSMPDHRRRSLSPDSDM